MFCLFYDIYTYSISAWSASDEIYVYICMYEVVYYIYPANACMFWYIYKVREKLKSENNVRDVLFFYISLLDIASRLDSFET